MQLLHLAAAVALTSSVVACGGAQKEGQRDDPCADVELDVERVWSAEIRAEFLGKGGTVAAETREGIATKMDALARDWVMLRRSVCLDHFRRGVIPRETYVLRAKCLDESLQEQRSFLSAVAEDAGVDATVRLQALSDGVRGCGGR